MVRIEDETEFLPITYPVHLLNSNQSRYRPFSFLSSLVSFPLGEIAKSLMSSFEFLLVF